jgi:urea carboxylase-associated protein 1
VGLKKRAGVRATAIAAPPPGPAKAAFILKESGLDPERAIYSETILAGRGWSRELTTGQILRIVDVEGNQAADTLFFNARDLEERYSAGDTISAQGNIYLTTGTALMSSEGRPLLTIVADTCGRHDTLGGACSAESNQVRYALDKKFMHNCRDSFLLALARLGRGMGKRDLPSNINFFMNVPVTPEGGLSFEDGVSAPGRYVELRADMGVLALISNCPQLNNPCNAYNPTPVRLLVWESPW